jgi:hypothetical protein
MKSEWKIEWRWKERKIVESMDKKETGSERKRKSHSQWAGGGGEGEREQWNYSELVFYGYAKTRRYFSAFFLRKELFPARTLIQ